MNSPQTDPSEPLRTKVPLTGTALRSFEAKVIRKYLEESRYFHDSETKEFVSNLVRNDSLGIVPWRSLSQAVSSMEHDTIVFSLVSSEYLAVGDLWVSKMQASGISEFFLVCGDEKSFRHFSGKGCRCVRVCIPDFDSAGRNPAGFNPKALVLTSLKFLVTKRLLALDRPVLFSDIDALWLKDVRHELEQKTCAFAFQNVHSFPGEFAAAWGFSACSGFFYVEPQDNSIKLIDTANDYVALVADDQLALNIAIAEQSPQWVYAKPDLVEILPQKQDDPVRRQLLFGVEHDVRGSSDAGDLEMVALAHRTFRRHLRLNVDVASASVFHPNSPKEQTGKLRVFRQYGFI